MHVQHMYRAQAKAKVSARNRQMAGTVLQTAMQSAVQLRLIPFNPCLGIDKARPEKREMQVWDKVQVDAFLAEAKNDRLNALYVLAIATGMR
jgi:integrase